jgi:hypothetical protein
VTPSSDNDAARPHRLRWLIALLVLTGLVCFSFWQPLQQEFTTWLLIRAEAPSETALGDVVDRAKDRVALLEKLRNHGSLARAVALTPRKCSHCVTDIRARPMPRFGLAQPPVSR